MAHTRKSSCNISLQVLLLFSFIIMLSQMSNNMPVTQEKASSQPKVNLTFISVVGAMRGALGLPWEHPFDTLKTWMQSSNGSARQSCAQIYKSKGIAGFYSGFMINFLRVVSKQAYRWPLNIYLIAHFRRQFKGMESQNSLAGVATGVATALIESIIICPFERIKVWLMTSRVRQGYINFAQQNSIRSLLDGFSPVLIRQLLSWVSFLGGQQHLKQMLYRYHNKSRKEYQLNIYDLTFVSVCVCFLNTLVVMPADYVKTHFQKYGREGERAQKMWSFALKTYREIGLKGFYRGGGVKIVQYNINSFFTVPLFEKMLRKYDY